MNNSVSKSGNCLNIPFFKEIIFHRYTTWLLGPYQSWERIRWWLFLISKVPKTFVLLPRHEKCLCEYFVFVFGSSSYFSRTIIKNVRNTIEIGYSITVNKSQCSSYPEAAVFKEIRYLTPLNALILFQFHSKYLS